MRLYLLTARILWVLLKDPENPRYGLDLMRETGALSGAMYPALARLEAEGLVTAEWEQIDPRAEKRPPRRYYRLTPAGMQSARELATLVNSFRLPAGA